MDIPAFFILPLISINAIILSREREKAMRLIAGGIIVDDSRRYGIKRSLYESAFFGLE